jgi:hypothetical protein
MENLSDYMANEELPLGFTSELSARSEMMERFSNLSELEKRNIIDGAKMVDSQDDMRDYVENMYKYSD